MFAVSVASIMCVSALAFSGCGDKKAEVSQTPDETTPATTAVSTADEPTAQNYLESIGIDTATLGINPNIIHDSNPVGFQLDMPKNGDTIAVVHTSYGDITMRLFPEQAPKTVTNFVNLAKAGKYNNSLFSKVTKDFMVNGGYCGTSSYGDAFEDEFCDRLFRQLPVQIPCSLCQPHSLRKTAQTVTIPTAFPTALKSCMRKTVETPILTVHTMRLTEATRYLHR